MRRKKCFFPMSIDHQLYPRTLRPLTSTTPLRNEVNLSLVEYRNLVSTFSRSISFGEERTKNRADAVVDWRNFLNEPGEPTRRIRLSSKKRKNTRILFVDGAKPTKRFNQAWDRSHRKGANAAKRGKAQVQRLDTYSKNGTDD